MNCPFCNAPGQTAGTNCTNAACGRAIPAAAPQAAPTGTGMIPVSFGGISVQPLSLSLLPAGVPPQGTAVPASQTTQTTQTTAPASKGIGLAGGIFLGIVGAVFLLGGGYLVYKIVNPDTTAITSAKDEIVEAVKDGKDEIKDAVHEDGVKTRKKVKGVKDIAKSADTHAKAGANLAAANNDLLIPMAKRVNQTGKAIDYVADVDYNDDGTVKRARTLDEAISAAQLAARRAGRRIVVNTSTVDTSRMETDLRDIKDMLNAPPVLERVSP